MKTTKTLTFALTLEEAKKFLNEYNGDMLTELLGVLYPGYVSRSDVRDFALLATDPVKLEEKMEKHHICWVSVPNCLSEWGECIAAFPGIFFGPEDLDKMIAENKDGTKIVVTVDNHPVHTKEMLGNC